MASAVDLTALENDPRLFLYTSLTAGSSHIITATSRMETILKANKIPFQAIDIATDEKARRLWQRRAGQRKIPGLVKEGYVLGDLNEVEEWNEFGELRENIGPVPANNAAPKGGQVGVQTAPPLSHNVSAVEVSNSKPATVSNKPQQTAVSSKGFALPGAAEIAARNKKTTPTEQSAYNSKTASVSTSSTASVKFKDEPKRSQAAVDHLSAPASRIQSGTSTPVTSEEKPSDTATVAVQSPVEKVAQQEEEGKSAEEESKKPTEEGIKEKPVDEEVTQKPVEETQQQNLSEETLMTKSADGKIKEKSVEQVENEVPVKEAKEEKHHGSDSVETPSEQSKKAGVQDELVEEDGADAKDTITQTSAAVKKLKVDEQAEIQAVESKADGEKAA